MHFLMLVLRFIKTNLSIIFSIFIPLKFQKFQFFILQPNILNNIGDPVIDNNIIDQSTHVQPVVQCALKEIMCQVNCNIDKPTYFISDLYVKQFLPQVKLKVQFTRAAQSVNPRTASISTYQITPFSIPPKIIRLFQNVRTVSFWLDDKIPRREEEESRILMVFLSNSSLI